jgi:hypothetical protein
LENLEFEASLDKVRQYFKNKIKKQKSWGHSSSVRYKALSSTPVLGWGGG